jgi:hypothetical protein
MARFNYYTSIFLGFKKLVIEPALGKNFFPADNPYLDLLLYIPYI